MSRNYCTAEYCKEVLTRLLRINSTQPEGNEKNVVDEIVSLLPPTIHATRIEHSSNRHSLIIGIPGQQNDGGIAFIGHIDTVPAGDAQLWQHPPFSAADENGRIFGRGAVDMKGGVTAMLAAALSISASRRTPKEPIYFCFTADEENLGLGAIELSRTAAFSSVREFWIAEPTSGDIGICEKGVLWLRLTAKGKLAHGSRPDIGVNSIEWLVWLYKELYNNLDKISQNNYLGTATLSITKLNGGIATNVIPDNAVMELDIRTIPGMCHEDIMHLVSDKIANAEATSPPLQITMDVLNDRAPVWVSDTDPMVKRIDAVCARQGLKPSKKGICFYTDASQIIPVFQKPFVIMGPGNDSLAHQINECILLEDVVDMAQLYKDYLEAYYFDHN